MELKSRGGFQRLQRYESSNRTFMELKLTSLNNLLSLLEGSNRTFMELKLFDDEVSQLLHWVLIAPLWN